MFNSLNDLTDSLGGVVAFMGMPTGMEWIVLLILGLLIFGRRLPEVGRSLGKGIVEFKKGIRGIDEEIEEQSSESPKSSRRHELPQQQADSEFAQKKKPYAAVEERPSE
ncbi:MAG: twin-arginine translocase TatA/TatE family subunit [Phycisphaerales bacterium]|nr:twin-arginine translocase TatA/TatE family subunit [Phycisphaerales bacterium]MCI0630469.1 twin-arginine translocase TatA/TatE family subunit [Phycisphaerales bacterium]MCI0676476.1 twin-arginine translocase TatA/TatE family subunit [Phycisphaerales bacterium]